MSRLLSLAAVFTALTLQAFAGTILVQSTTSTQDSGIYEYLLPLFEAETGIKVNVVAVGTGQAIKNAQNGDADVLLVHSKADEEKFVAEGYGVARFDVMYNDFVIIGPKDDPLHIADYDYLNAAMAALASGKAIFVSRGDDSGTHKKELKLWTAAGINPLPSDVAWYRSSGSGMGATLRMALELQGYTLSDRATWIAYQDKQDAHIVFEGDKALFNQYGVIVVNPDKFPHANIGDANNFSEWLRSPHGQELIAAYQINGQQLFYPNAAY